MLPWDNFVYEQIKINLVTFSGIQFRPIQAKEGKMCNNFYFYALYVLSEQLVFMKSVFLLKVVKRCVCRASCKNKIFFSR